MSSAIAAQNFLSSLPTIGQTRAAQVTGLRPNTASTSGSGSSSGSSAGDIGTTFLSLLSQELQNQDPTAPVDSTAMVGQMISLNQLDQLISINQLLSQVSTSASTPTTSAAAKAQGAAAINPASTSSPSGTGSAYPQTQLPFDPNTLMPLNLANPSGAAAAASQLFGLGIPGSNN